MLWSFRNIWCSGMLNFWFGKEKSILVSQTTKMPNVFQMISWTDSNVFLIEFLMGDQKETNWNNDINKVSTGNCLMLFQYLKLLSSLSSWKFIVDHSVLWLFPTAKKYLFYQGKYTLWDLPLTLWCGEHYY